MFDPKRTPVRGIRKYRGGGYGFHRYPQTTPERRLNQAMPDEPAARWARQGRHLPTSWDDLPRTVQRCWKAQRKGRKTWARA